MNGWDGGEEHVHAKVGCDCQSKLCILSRLFEYISHIFYVKIVTQSQKNPVLLSPALYQNNLPCWARQGPEMVVPQNGPTPWN